MIMLEDLRRSLDYDPQTGDFRWKVKTSPRNMPGKIAGYLGSDGYWRINFRNKKYLAHRVAWFYVYGDWPAAQLDHINRSRADNRIENLRSATASQNGANKRVVRAGLKGATRHKNGWQAQIKLNGRVKYLGLFEDELTAHEVYQRAAQELHGVFASAE